MEGNLQPLGTQVMWLSVERSKTLTTYSGSKCMDVCRQEVFTDSTNYYPGPALRGVLFQALGKEQ